MTLDIAMGGSTNTVLHILAAAHRLAVDDAELARRRTEQAALGWKPAAPRKRRVTTALLAHAAMATSAAGGV